MKKITLLFITLLISAVGISQNLIQDGTFDTQTGVINSTSSPWAGFTAQVLPSTHADDPNTANANNGEASIYQVVTVVPGETYKFLFDYKWIGTGNYVMTVRVKDDLAAGRPNLDLIGGTSSNGFTLGTTPNTWVRGATFSLLAPAGVTQVRLLFYKTGNNRPVRLDNISMVKDATASVEDFAKFNFSHYPNPTTNELNISASKNIEKIEIFNLIGQKVISSLPNINKTKVNVSSLNTGIYIMKATIDGVTDSFKFIKE
jgi:hypothetical protein|tara:strand:+ start:44 stop:820 length:777 start_codon:yes stop_codon:yes gene_type:complete